MIFNRYVLISFLVSSILFGSCNGRTGENKITEITIPHFDGNFIKSDDFIEIIDSIELSFNGDFIANIQDACYQDSLLFVLDTNHSIFAFNTNNGNLIKKIRHLGRSNSDYLEPKAITIDETYFYVLDLQGMKINRYDLQLNFVDCTKIEFPALDFAKVDGGFLLYNLLSNEYDKQIVYVGLDGRTINSFVKPSMEMNRMVTDKIFSEGENGSVFISLPMSNCIYSWEDDSVNIKYNIGFEGENNDIKVKESSQLTEKNISLPMRSFVTSKYVLTYYNSPEINYLPINIYDKERKVSESGIATFNPISSSNQGLIDVYNLTEDGDDAENLIFMRYRLKR